MNAEFLREVAERVHLSDADAQILGHVGVGNWEELHSLVTTFPSLKRLGLDTSGLAAAAESTIDPSLVQAATAPAQRKVAFGALPPPHAPFTLNAVVGLPSALLALMAPAAPIPGPIDLRVGAWPVRDQGHRGTCVSFGAAACTEVLAHFGGGHYDLSEQFLYWAIKTKTTDPAPNKDGTWLSFAQQALSVNGICPEGDWPYQPQVVSPVSGAGPGVPSAIAFNQAAQYRPSATSVPAPGATSTAILAVLQQGRPVAVTLPVFTDPSVPNAVSNFETPISWQYGRILNPPPTAVVSDGHCVCITGFAPDPSEPKGGYFIVRNSWGARWGAQNPGPGGRAPEPGYGDLPASYVDRFCWEMFAY